jgi:hypothetical protein
MARPYWPDQQIVEWLFYDQINGVLTGLVASYAPIVVE